MDFILFKEKLVFKELYLTKINNTQNIQYKIKNTVDNLLKHAYSIKTFFYNQ